MVITVSRIMPFSAHGAQERASDHSLSVNGLNSGASNKSAFELQKQFPSAAAPRNAHCLPVRVINIVWNVPK